MTTRAEVQLPSQAMFVGGEWRESHHGDTFPVVDPATESVIADLPSASERDVDEAVMSARRQFDDGPWARLSGADRGRLLWRVAELIERDTANLAALEAIDVGKPLGDPLMVDIPLAAETFRHFAGWADKVQGTTVPVPDFLAARDSRTRYASRSVWSVRLRPGTPRR
jgi:acyl-CoA reductase-like NAD-dependent aldehyde dehydrogenase